MISDVQKHSLMLLVQHLQLVERMKVVAAKMKKNKWLKKNIKKFAGTVSTTPVPAIKGVRTPYADYT